MAEIGGEQALRDGLLVVLGPVPDLAHAVERPEVKQSGPGSKGRVGVETDRLMGAGLVRDAVTMGLHVGGDRLARRVVEGDVCQRWVGRR